MELRRLAKKHAEDEANRLAVSALACARRLNVLVGIVKGAELAGVDPETFEGWLLGYQNVTLGKHEQLQKALWGLE